MKSIGKEKDCFVAVAMWPGEDKSNGDGSSWMDRDDNRESVTRRIAFLVQGIPFATNYSLPSNMTMNSQLWSVHSSLTHTSATSAITKSTVLATKRIHQDGLFPIDRVCIYFVYQLGMRLTDRKGRDHEE